MTAVNRTATAKGQKLLRQATSVTEDTYTITLANPTGATGFSLQLQPSTVGVFYHTTSGQTQADGYPIAAGATFTIPLGTNTVFYISAQSATGTLDLVVL